MIRSALLDAVAGVIHGFSDRSRHVPPPPPEPSEPVQVRPLLEALGAPEAGVAILNQVHGAAVLRARAGGPCWPVGPGDALVCTEPGLVIYVRVADCTPVLLAGPRGVAAVHAGWRGTVEGVLPAAIERLCAWSGQRPEDLRAAVGPSIGPCCYEVGPEVVEGLARHAPREVFLRERGAGRRPMVDVGAVNLHLLEKLGIPAERLAGCTRCDQRFHSWRRDGVDAGRQAALIGIHP
jgi:YfiH family protein